jgi:hypothetical protein
VKAGVGVAASILVAFYPHHQDFHSMDYDIDN